MKSRLIMEFLSSQFIATAVGVVDQFYIVYCNAILRSTASTSLHKLEGSICNMGEIYLIDVFFM